MPQEAQADPNNNKVYRSEGGHVVEFDNTLNASRIKVTHNKGTSILIDKDGNVTIDASSAGNTIAIKGNTTVTGTLHVSDKITGNADIVADNDDTKISLLDHKHDTKLVQSGSSTITSEEPS